MGPGDALANPADREVRRGHPGLSRALDGAPAHPAVPDPRSGRPARRVPQGGDLDGRERGARKRARHRVLHRGPHAPQRVAREPAAQRAAGHQRARLLVLASRAAAPEVLSLGRSGARLRRDDGVEPACLADPAAARPRLAVHRGDGRVLGCVDDVRASRDDRDRLQDRDGAALSRRHRRHLRARRAGAGTSPSASGGPCSPRRRR